MRLDEGHAANYVLRSVSGRILVDGVKRSGSGPTNWVDSVGELSGSFADVRANSVSGAVTVLRRAASVDHTSREEVDSPRAGIDASPADASLVEPDASTAPAEEA